MPRADVHDGHGAAARERRAEAPLPAADRRRGASPPGLRGHRADRGLGHDPHPDDRRALGRRLRRARTEGVHLARAPVRPHAPARADDAARRGGEEERRPLGLPRRHEGRRRQAHHPSAPDDDEPRDDRGLPRRRRAACGRARRRGGPGLPLHPRRHERGADPHRGRVHRRRALVRREGGPLRIRAGRVRTADRRQPGRSVPGRAGARGRSRPPT